MKAKKKIKGMTLIEVIIAIFVLGVMGTIMARVATISCNLMRQTKHMNNKVELEAPMAAAQEIAVDATEIATDIPLKITGSFDASSVPEIKAKKYTTSQKVAGNELARTNVNADLYYYTYETVPTT